MALRSVVWVGGSRDNLRSFSKQVRRFLGRAIFRAQQGLKHPKAKPLHGFGGAGVLEIVADAEGNTYRAVYTVRFADLIYVLHCFSEEINQRHQYPETGIRTHKEQTRFGGGRLCEKTSV